MKNNWVPIDDEKRSDWEAICPVGDYRVIQAEDVPSIISPALVEKGHSFLIMASGSTAGTAYFMINTNRIDEKDGAIDRCSCRR